MPGRSGVAGDDLPPIVVEHVSGPIEAARDRPEAGALTHRAARDTAIRAVADVLGKVATLAWTVAAVRVLTQDDFGALSYALSVMLLVTALPTWGFDTGVSYEGSRSPEQLSALYTRNLVWKTLLGIPTLVVAGVVVGVARPTGHTVLVLVLVLAAGLPEIFSSTSRAAATARSDPRGVSGALVGQRFLTAVAVALALALGTGVVGVSVAFAGATTVGWVLHVRATRRLDVRFERSAVTVQGLRDLWSTTAVVGASSIVLMVLFRADMVFLGLLAGDQAVAQYAVAYRLLETVLFVTFAINQTVVPIMSASTGGERARKALEQAVALAGLLYVPFGVVVLTEGHRILALLFGDDYGDSSASSLAWLAPAPLLFAICFFAASLLTSRERYLPALVAAVVAVVVNIVANLVLIPRFESAGAAASTSLSYAVYLVALLIGVRYAGQTVSVLRPLVVGLLASGPLAVLLVVVNLPLWAELGLGAALYLCVWFVLARRFAPVQVEVALGFLRRRSAR